VAVPAAHGARPVSAVTQPGYGTPVETIGVLEVDLGLPWTAFGACDAPILVGALPVDSCGTVLADAAALDSWVGFLQGERSVDGLRDVTYHGKDQDLVRHQFGGEQLRSDPGRGAYGWRDPPLDLAHQPYP